MSREIFGLLGLMLTRLGMLVPVVDVIVSGFFTVGGSYPLVLSCGFFVILPRSA